MNMLDRIALAKAGYKKKEIEEMLAADTNNEELAPTKSALSLGNGSKETQPAAEDQEETQPAVENQEEPEEQKITENQENSENLSDIKDDELIEELQNKVLELEKKLSNAQANNINRDRNIENPIEKAEQKLYDVITNFG